MAEASVIGSTTVVRGNVRGDGDMEILGRVDGDVLAGGDVTIGEDAQVRGRVTGAVITVAGLVVGDITGTASITLTANAQVQGDLITPRVGIAEGARVRGSLNTEGGGEGRGTSRSREVPRQAAPSRALPAKAIAPAAKTVARSASPASPVAGKRKPPPPVVPALRKGVRARKKSRG
jgi:cytoskeletal protein CcmA (bactofilin family)